MTSKSKLLLISDLDDTLLGQDDALRRFHEFFQRVQEHVSLIYASGRFFASVMEDVRNTVLPPPIAVIGGVGSEIRRYPNGELNKDWMQLISRGWCAQVVRDLLADEDSLELQPQRFQSDFKVSYFLRQATTGQLHRLKRRLELAGIPASLIYSSGRDLDILPAGVNKGAAAAFVASQLGFALDRVIVAGNSGNDATLFDHDFCGIVVSNALPELQHHVAGQPRVYNSLESHADGVLDGLRYWLGQCSES